jgi:hypothetical protein
VYAELGTAVPRSGGEHAYLMYTFAKEKDPDDDEDEDGDDGGGKKGVKKDIYKKKLPPTNQVPRKPHPARRLPAFLYDWVALLIIRPTMFAIMSLSLGTYAVKPFYPTCDPPPIVVKLVTAAAMCQYFIIQ